MAIYINILRGKPLLQREWKDKEEGGGRFGSRGDGAQWGDGGGSYRLLRAISNFTYEMVEIVEENRKDAVLGSIGQDVRCSRLGRFDNFYPFH